MTPEQETLVNRRLDALESNIDGLIAAIQSIKGIIETQRKMNDALDKRIAATEDALDKNNIIIGRIGEIVEDFRRRIEGTERGLKVVIDTMNLESK